MSFQDKKTKQLIITPQRYSKKITYMIALLR